MRTSSGKILITLNEWLLAGLGSSCFKHARREGRIEATRACKGNPVEIVYDTLPEEYKEKITTALNPKERLAALAINQHLITDYEAVNYFNSYRLADGTGLPMEHIRLYITQAQWLNMLHTAVNAKNFKQKYGCTRSEFQKTVTAEIKNQNIGLCANYSNLRKQLREYLTSPTQGVRNYESLISNRFGKKNAEKLSDEAKDWLIAQYSSPTKPDTARLHLLYINECDRRNQSAPLKDGVQKNRTIENPQIEKWTPVTEKCIYHFLHKPEVECLWYFGRHGYLPWKNRFEHHAKTFLPTYRDALWQSDGTKLNFFTNGLQATLNIYKVVDCYSECIIGFDISNESENYKNHYNAFRMAVKQCGSKPYQILYDNQGGHKKEETQNFFTRLSKVHFPAQPYNSQAKQIESIIGRFQKQVMSRYWFFTGQNVTAKMQDSKPNLDFYMQHRKELPSTEALKEIAVKCIEQWNNSPHPKHGKSRRQLYMESVNPEPRPVDYFDMIELFWLTTKDEITYRRGGLILNVGKDKYEFEALDENGNPDLTLIQRRFYVKYDLEDLSQVMLYEQVNGDLRFVAAASEKTAVPRAMADYTEGTREQINKLLQLRKQQKQATRQTLEEIRERANYSLPVIDTEPEQSDCELVLAAAAYAPKETVTRAEANLYLDYSTLNEGKILDDESFNH